MIVIPMAGLSRRFTEAGYDLPKYMLAAHGKSLFRHAVESFSHYFGDTPFLFVLRDVAGSREFVAAECAAMGLPDPMIVVLEEPTSGQAETVMQGLRSGNCRPDMPVTIFNIDTFRPDFRFPTAFDLTAVDGYLEVFVGSGKNWSFVRPIEPGSDRVAETAEKREISNLCCTGLYHFSRYASFESAYTEHARLSPHQRQAGELYVAPLYNNLIRDGQDIRYHVIGRDEVLFCGTPQEYDEFLQLR